MSTEVEVVRPTSKSPSWLRSYPPIALLAIAVAMAALVLPSSLNLPNSNPTTLLEYAPVPPDDDDPQDSSGNLSTLNLGSSSSLSTGVTQKKINPPDEGGKGKKAVTKRCVGKPLRQTEDYNSPPCVPFFEGNNGGATWQGVTEDEVTILIYHSSFISDQNETEGGDTSAGESTPTGDYCDLDKPNDQQLPGGEWSCVDPSSGSELSVVEAARALSKYFNERFQTYGRHLHFYMYFTGANSSAGRKADANSNWETVKPFTVIDRATFNGYNDAYAEAMAKRRTSLFGSFGFLGGDFYRRNRPYVWTFWPDIEHWAEMYSSYVCMEIAGKPVSHAGDDKQEVKMNGGPRKYAIMSTNDPGIPGLHYFRELVREKISRCGITNPVDIRFPYAGANLDSRPATESDNPNYPFTNVAKMQNEGVTTVLWLGGLETSTTKAAKQASYFPEWIIAGDRQIDDNLNARNQDQDVWAHAWAVSTQLREVRFEESPARQAYREAEPGGRQIHEYWATTLYKDMFAVAKAIQVAGPELTPDAIDQGHHAIPRYSSNDPRVAACFYDPGDYSCVKDTQETWWDPRAPDPNGESGQFGCWRMVREGKRFLAGASPAGDDVFRNPNDTCNGIKGTVQNYI